jgi:hypothetical protein
MNEGDAELPVEEAHEEPPKWPRDKLKRLRELYPVPTAEEREAEWSRIRAEHDEMAWRVMHPQYDNKPLPWMEPDFQAQAEDWLKNATFVDERTKREEDKNSVD